MMSAIHVYLISYDMLNLICDPKKNTLKLINVPGNEADYRTQVLNFAASRPSTNSLAGFADVLDAKTIYIFKPPKDYNSIAFLPKQQIWSSISSFC